MRCELCGNNTRVIDSRKDTDIVIRKRKCVKCGHCFFTQEIDIDYLQGLKLINTLYTYRKVDK